MTEVSAWRGQRLAKLTHAISLRRKRFGARIGDAKTGSGQYRLVGNRTPWISVSALIIVRALSLGVQQGPAASAPLSDSLRARLGYRAARCLLRSNSRNTPICSVLPQQHRIARLFKPTHLRLEGCPQSYPPFGWMCCNQTMSVSEMITASEHKPRYFC